MFNTISEDKLFNPGVLGSQQIYHYYIFLSYPLSLFMYGKDVFYIGIMLGIWEREYMLLEKGQRVGMCKANNFVLAIRYVLFSSVSLC